MFLGNNDKIVVYRLSVEKEIKISLLARNTFELRIGGMQI